METQENIVPEEVTQPVQVAELEEVAMPVDTPAVIEDVNLDEDDVVLTTRTLTTSSVTVKDKARAVVNSTLLDDPLGVEPIMLKPDSPLQNVSLEENYTTPLDKSDKSASTDELPMPSDYKDRVVSAMTHMPRNKEYGTKEIDYITALAAGDELCSHEDQYMGSVTRKDSNFSQAIIAGGLRLKGGYPKSTLSNKPVGDDAVFELSRIMGKGPGIRYTFPLWATGIWITVKSPESLEILELHRELTSDLVNLGRDTYGYALTNLRAITNKRLVDFVMDHVYSTSINSDKPLEEIILASDLEALLWGMICSIYPHGFKYSRACSSNPEKCQHVITETLSVHSLAFTDMSALSEKQVTHMRKVRKASMTYDEVKAYQNDHKVGTPKTFEWFKGERGDINATLHNCTVAEHLEAGQRWVNNIATIVGEALGVENNGGERNTYMVNAARATLAMQYSHMVSDLEVGENRYHAKKDGDDASDSDSLEKILTEVSSDDDMLVKFIKECVEYNNSNQVTVIGIPVFDCPECGGENTGVTLPRHVNIIPLDTYRTFFGLLVQRVQKTLARLPL